MYVLMYLGMAETQKSPVQSAPQGEVFTLKNIHVSPQKVKYTPPRVKVINTFDLSGMQNLNWFMDTYNYEGEYQDDLHLYVKKEGTMYGDMGSIVNAKEDVTNEAIPCITITVLPEGETTKATNILLLFSTWTPFDMTSSKQGKDNSFVKLGLNISNFSDAQASGVESIAQLIKGIRNAKGMLCIGKKTIGKKRANTINKERAIVQSKGRELVKSAIARLSGDDTTSSSKILPPLQATRNLKNVQSKAEGTRKGSPQSRQISKGKRSMPVKVTINPEALKRQKTSMSLEVSNDQEALKRQKTSMPLEVIDDQEPLEETDIPSQQLAIVNPSL